MKIKLLQMSPEIVADEIGDFIVEKTVEHGYNGGVIGLSGGVDSTTTAALAKRAYDLHGLELVGYILPSKVNNPKDAEDGIKVAQRLGIRYEVVSIEGILNEFAKTNPVSFESKLAKGNLMSETRAVILHGKSATEKKILLGTGNRDEDFELGYYTLFGDGAVHISPIAGLPKRLVRDMARYLGFSDLADRVPTAGLEVGQTDFKDIGYSYDTVELIGEAFKQGMLDLEQIAENEQVKRQFEKDKEEYIRLYGKPKFEDVNSLIRDYLHRNRSARYKSQIVHPPTPKISLFYGD